MTTVRHLPGPDGDEALFARLRRLAWLEVELSLAETRRFLRTLAVAVAVAVVAAIALVAGLVVLLAGALAPLFDGVWPPLVIAGGGAVVVAAAGLAWSTWRLRRLHWPREIFTSFEENWRWLAAQLRSRLTSRSRAA
ncbi:MAG TPA: phage holin family protein [Methylomirabilota bacterium]|nr:phage holin family protein [Methylomirabilota bacterium]